MRDNSMYRVVPAPKLQRAPGYPIAPPRTPQGSLYQDNDTNSVFAGGLPDSVTEAELREVFSMFGTILSCNIISKPMTSECFQFFLQINETDSCEPAGGMNTFAFIEFKYTEDATSAANTTASSLPALRSLAYTDDSIAICAWTEDSCGAKTIRQASCPTCWCCCKPDATNHTHSARSSILAWSVQQRQRNGISWVPDSSNLQYGSTSSLQRRTTALQCTGLPYDAPDSSVHA
jgi:hypothetical protein